MDARNNFEILKAMSMDEMARFIARQRGWYCNYKDPEDDEYPKALEWLKEELDDAPFMENRSGE